MSCPRLPFPFIMTEYGWIRVIGLIWLVDDLLIVELKCVPSLLPIHKAQLLTYLRLANKPIGVLLNFNVVHMRDGIKRILNNRYWKPAAAGSNL